MGVLVSCLCPTKDRRAYLPSAIACFLAQDYPERELVILDDGTDPVADLVPADPRIRYERCHRMNLGAKRNLCCATARGDVFAHWDDDDVSAPNRLSDQVTRLLESGAELTGYRTMAFADEAMRAAWVYHGKEFYAVGTSMMYTREFWQRRAFPALAVGEDAAFLNGARRVAIADGAGMIVARLHDRNTADKPRAGLKPPKWTPLAWNSLPEWFRR